jgi:biopolymer transport protein ExbD
MAGGISRSDDDDLDDLAEINVTPFIDVMLVLLIVFMIAAPLSTVDIAVDLPVSNAKPQKRPDKPLFMTIKADRSLAVGEESVSLVGLPRALDVVTEQHRDRQIFVRADKTIVYDDLMRVLNQLRIGGYLKVALVGLEGTGGAPDAEGGTAHAPDAPPFAATGSPP